MMNSPADLGIPVADLTPPRNQYVLNHFARLGLDATGLSESHRMAVFALLSRLEEYETTTKYNGHNWELCFARLPRADLALVPILETWMCSWLSQGKLVPLPQVRARWPQGKKFCLCLTHDVDCLHEYQWRDRLRNLRYLRQAPEMEKLKLLASFFKHCSRRLTAWRPKPTPPLEAWLEVEASLGFKSTFLFLADPIPEPCWEDHFYKYSDRVDFEGRKTPIGEVIRQVAARGWDVGLHGSCRSHTRADLLKVEKETVGRAAGVPVTSVRQHHLCCDVRHTPRAQAQAGLRTDSTFGSNLQPGFRCGTSLPFFFYDLSGEGELPLLEIPLVIQDIALFGCLAGDEQLGLRRSLEIMDRVAEVGGVLTLLWHNEKRPDSPAFGCYRAILKEAAARGAWGCSMRELDNWWRGRMG